MEALARGVAGLLVRGGWMMGLVVLETLLLAGFWLSGPTPFGDAFDRRAAEADLLLLTLTSLPALFAGALLASGDREDGMGDFARSCGITPRAQAGGTLAGLFAVLAGALTVSLAISLLVAPQILVSGTFAVTGGLALLSTAIHGAWGVALGSWFRSRWSAVAGALVFWLLTVFALEALVTAVLGAVPARYTFGVLGSFLAADPSQFVRVATVFLRGQGWAYGPAFAPLRELLATPLGWGLLAALSAAHLALPFGLALAGWSRRAP